MQVFLHFACESVKQQVVTSASPAAASTLGSNWTSQWVGNILDTVNGSPGRLSVVGWGLDFGVAANGQANNDAFVIIPQ